MWVSWKYLNFKLCWLDFRTGDACRDLLLAMHQVPLEFDAKAIQDVLERLTSEAARIMWCSPDFEASTEPPPPPPPPKPVFPPRRCSQRLSGFGWQWLQSALSSAHVS